MEGHSPAEKPTKRTNPTPKDAILPEFGLVRLDTVLALLDMSKAAWYAGIKSGKFPAPTKLGSRVSRWRANDIRHLIENGVDEAA